MRRWGGGDLPLFAAPPCHPNTCEYECLGLGYCVRLRADPVPCDPDLARQADLWREPEDGA
jgi:hypothetical protein